MGEKQKSERLPDVSTGIPVLAVGSRVRWTCPIDPSIWSEGEVVSVGHSRPVGRAPYVSSYEVRLRTTSGHWPAYLTPCGEVAAYLARDVRPSSDDLRLN